MGAMDEPKAIPLAESTQGAIVPEQKVETAASTALDLARGSGHIGATPQIPERRERSEHSVIMALPDAAKAERIAAMRRELAELQRQLIEAQQRIATELQGRADDAERFEALEARLQAKEVELEQHTVRAAERDTEIATLRTQLESANEKADEFRRDVATRAAQIEEASQQQRNATDELAKHATTLQETKTLLETRDAELVTRTAERDAEIATRVRLEGELEAQRKEHREATEKLEVELTSARDAKALVVARDAEAAAMTTERDALKGELEQAKRELEAARCKVRDVAADLVRLGQALTDGAGPAAVAPPRSGSEPEAVAAPSVKRPQPPPMPPRRATPAEPQVVETIIEVTEDPKPAARLRTGLLMLVGVVVGCGVTVGIMKGSSSSSTAAGYSHDPAAPSPALVAPVAAEGEPARPAAPVTVEPVFRFEPIAAPSPSAAQPAADMGVTKEPTVETGVTNESAAAPAMTATEGVIMLPKSANGRRVFVDGRVVKVESSRAVIPCGSRKVRIGSTGTDRTFDIACGAETSITDEPRDRD